jgi:hypothetical protein
MASYIHRNTNEASIFGINIANSASMKSLNCTIIVNIVCCFLKSVCFGSENDYRTTENCPSSDHIKLLYQMRTVDRMFDWNIERRCYVLTPFGEPIYRSVQDLACECMPGLPLGIRPIRPNQRSLAVNALLKKYISSCYRKDHVGVFLDFLSNKLSLTALIPAPDTIIPAEDEVEQDFLNDKPFVQIFGECMRTPSMGMIMREPEHCEERKRKGESCNITALDCSIVERVLRQSQSSSKTILFVGFDQTLPTEGGNIYAHTSGYERSLFLSAEGVRPSGDHNQIKTCFCQMPRLLEMYPDMRNAFDYIIVGGQTREYVYPDAWVVFGRMLKPGGRLVYPAYGSSPQHDLLFSLCLNRILIENVAEEGFGFELYKCDNVSELIYQEIQQVAAFNSIPTYGSFCYAQNETLLWHKKTVLSRE